MCCVKKFTLNLYIRKKMKLKTLSLVISTVIATTSFSVTAAFISNTPQPTQVQGSDLYPTHKINTTISDKILWKDDQQFFLKGKITKQVKKDKFLFTDGTGEVVLEIEDEDWDGVDIQQDEEFIVKAQVDVKDKGTKELEAIEIFKNK